MIRLSLIPAHHAAPFVGRGLTAGHLTLAQIAALVAPLGVVLVGTGAAGAALFALALSLALGWEAAFALLRRKPITRHGISTAMILTVALPEGLPLWQAGIAISFGVVLGELIFGGRGYGFLSPSVVVLAFLAFSFPAVALPGMGPWVVVATLPGALLLLTCGMISWRVIAGFVAGFIAIFVIADAPFAGWQSLVGLVFGIVFLLCDPVAVASTNLGRWVQGSLAGGLTVAFAATLGVSLAALVFAALLGSLFAPLVDNLICMVIARKREGRGHV